VTLGQTLLVGCGRVRVPTPREQRESSQLNNHRNCVAPVPQSKYPYLVGGGYSRHHPLLTMSGKYVFNKGLKELRFLFCQTSSHSEATRSVYTIFFSVSGSHSNSGFGYCRAFINRAYPTMKKNNPYVPILIREASGTEPKIFARYGTIFQQEQ
jgi:hypothetical protein